MAQIFGIDHKYFAVSTLALSAGVAAYSVYKLNKCSNKTVSVGNKKSQGSDLYESERLLSEYLVFHYGTAEQLIPYPFGPKESLDFPKRCAELCLKWYKPQETVPNRALDIGCAVGRSSFELTRGCQEVVGIDYSQSFIDAANELKVKGILEYNLVQEGDIFTPAIAEVGKDLNRSQVRFEQGDACSLRPDLGEFGLVLAANLVCRLHSPKAFLHSLTKMLPHKGSVLVITAPYTWLREFTDKSVWLGGYTDSSGKAVTGFETLQKELGPFFDLAEEVNMPFFIRETARKNQWTVAHATVWIRK